MATDYVSHLAKDAGLTNIEIAVLDQAGVRTDEDVHSLTEYFPSIVDAGFRLNVVSNAVAQQISQSYLAVANATSTQPPQIGLGANPPPGSPISLNSAVGLPPPPPFTPPPTAPANSIDLRLSPWPVRDQGQRGTCVAFGTTAAVEKQQASEAPNPDYSEQFLYWAIKNHSSDPNKTKDGTWLQFSRDMLMSDGICHESFHPYVGTVVSPISGPPPSTSAIADAASHKFTPTTYIRRPSGAAALVWQLLGHGRLVAISLPVFRDPAVPNGPINWATPVGWAYGRVLNPPIRSVVVGGHCVCVTGFVPDTLEPGGGYFIIRNSWGTQWANLAPAAGSSHSPEQGYGEISATYLDMYCWELLQI
jgi:hypothetical protein